MGILVDKNSKVIVQGMIGSEGVKYSCVMKEFGIQVVVGVIFGKGGQDFEGWLIYNLVVEVKEKYGVNVLIIFVFLVGVVDVVFEVVYVGIFLIVLIIEGVFIVDMMCVVQEVKEFDVYSKVNGGQGVCLIGGNCFGLVINGEVKVGIMFNCIYINFGCIGLISCLGILIYEVVKLFNDVGMGIFIIVGIGGDFVIGMIFVDVLLMFEVDEGIDVVVVIGEIGGVDEEVVVEYIKNNMKKFVVVFILGCFVLVGKCMGYVGVIIMGDVGIFESKFVVFKVVNVLVVDIMFEIIDLVKQVLNK